MAPIPEQKWHQGKRQPFFIFQGTLMKTFSAKPAEVQHEWFVIDATDKVL